MNSSTVTSAFLSTTSVESLNLHDDPFSDLSKLRRSQDFIAHAGVKKPLISVPVRKPPKHNFFRVHPEEGYRMTLDLLLYDVDREFYLVLPDMVGLLQTLDERLVASYRVYTCVIRQGTVFLWPVRLPGDDGKDLDWWRTAHECAVFATKQWVRITANMEQGAYEPAIAENLLVEPQWPDRPFNELLRIGLKNRMIDNPDHEVVRQLRGAV
jgi:hypothetical protein